jgi:hypothetical protein
LHGGVLPLPGSPHQGLTTPSTGISRPDRLPGLPQPGPTARPVHHNATMAHPLVPSPARLRALLAALEHGLLERDAAVRLLLLAALAGSMCC